MFVLQKVRLIQHRPCWRSEVGREQGFRISIFQPWLLPKKRSYQTALDSSPNDEQTFIPAEHWPRFITQEAVLSDSQPISLTKMSPFLIQKGIQGIVGTPMSVEKLKSSY